MKSLPLAVQQKQIVVTCNYEARRRGLRKLQLIKDAKKICPDVVIVLGEDLTKFRDASKELFSFLQGFVWGGHLEKLGFDEVSMSLVLSAQDGKSLSVTCEVARSLEPASCSRLCIVYSCNARYDLGIFGCDAHDRL